MISDASVLKRLLQDNGVLSKYSEDEYHARYHPDIQSLNVTHFRCVLPANRHNIVRQRQLIMKYNTTTPQYLTAENMAVTVRSVVMQHPILPGTLSGGIRKLSQDTIMKSVLGR